MTAARRLLLLLTGINLVNYLDRYVVAAVIEPLGRDLGLTDTQRGWVNGVFLLAYMVGAPLFGMLADRFHRPRLVALGVALWSLATAGACLVHGFWELPFTRSLDARARPTSHRGCSTSAVSWSTPGHSGTRTRCRSVRPLGLRSCT